MTDRLSLSDCVVQRDKSIEHPLPFFRFEEMDSIYHDSEGLFYIEYDDYVGVSSR